MIRPPSSTGQPSLAPDAEHRWVDTESSVCALGVCGNMTLIVWWTQATGAAVERVARLTRDVCAEYPRISNIHLIREGAPLPTPAARSGFVAMMRDHAEQLANVAVVVGGSGFWASTMRSAITGMRFVSPRTFELRLHGRAEEIASWLPAAHFARCGTRLRTEGLSALLSTAERVMADGVVEVQTLPQPTPLISQRVSLGVRKPRV